MPNRQLAAPIAVVLMLFVLACGSGSGGGTSPATSASGAAAAEPTAAPAAAAPGKVGDRIEMNGIALTVVKTEKKDELSQIEKAKNGNTFIVVEVLIENVSVDKAPYNPFYFKVKDSDGFESTPALGAGDQPLRSGELPKGDKARGTVAFEVKKDAKALVLSYKPLVLFSGDEVIRVALD